ncbi:MAG: histidine kinase [Rhodocyclaceae bacterium]|nr:histidine kinase [Rhodocyclaceae bacterium]
MRIPPRPPALRLPDFRNLGVWLRVLLVANGFLLATALAGNRTLALLPREVGELAALVEPALLLTLALLFVLSPFLQRLPTRLAGAAVVMLAVAATAGVGALLAQVLGGGEIWRAPLAAGVLALGMLLWFDLSARAHAPALAEAKLSALTARIRPHFLFNSLNAVLGVIREDPRRAETALEELAELFRALMQDNRELAPLSDEIALARKYLEIEHLRLGERLRVKWEVSDCPPDVLAPPLLLQPLIENAVYHGIEPAPEPAEIVVKLSVQGERVRIEIDNPWLGEGNHRKGAGNHMALANLRERLMLFYDLEATLDSSVSDGRYRVRIDLPTRRKLHHE